MTSVTVKSASRAGTVHHVAIDDHGCAHACTCEHHRYAHARCKHMFAAEVKASGVLYEVFERLRSTGHVDTGASFASLLRASIERHGLEQALKNLITKTHGCAHPLVLQRRHP